MDKQALEARRDELARMEQEAIQAINDATARRFAVNGALQENANYIQNLTKLSENENAAEKGDCQESAE